MKCILNLIVSELNSDYEKWLHNVLGIPIWIVLSFGKT